MHMCAMISYAYRTADTSGPAGGSAPPVIDRRRLPGPAGQLRQGLAQVRAVGRLPPAALPQRRGTASRDPWPRPRCRPLDVRVARRQRVERQPRGEAADRRPAAALRQLARGPDRRLALAPVRVAQQPRQPGDGVRVSRRRQASERRAQRFAPLSPPQDRRQSGQCAVVSVRVGAARRWRSLQNTKEAAFLLVSLGFETEFL